MKQDKTITSKRIKRRIITILIIMIAFFIMNMIAARIVFHFIFTRYEYAENNIDRIYSAEDASLYPREDVTFCSGKSKLTGRLYRTDSPKGILILAHGMHSYADRYLDVTEFFVDHGWDVLAFNMTGTYSSEGRDTVGLAQMKLDVIAAIHYVQGNSELCELPIVLYGHSMGGYAVATAIEQEIAAYEKQLRQHYSTKSRLMEEIDSLDPDDRHFIARKSDLDERLYKMYDKIEEVENGLMDARAKKQAIEADKITGDNIYKILICFDKLYATMTEAERRRLVEILIDEVQIYPERQPNGQWLKSVRFKLPIIDHDLELSLDNKDRVETVVLLSRVHTTK